MIRLNQPKRLPNEQNSSRKAANETDSTLQAPSLAIANDALGNAVRRARRRLVPFLLLMYVISFLDRANIGFAREALQKQVGISPQVYALAAGLFFVTYALFELPSNLILHRVGAKRWLARIMVTWGIISTATMFVAGSRSFYLLRLLLGAAEAGFFPGVILYLTYWFPSRARAEIFGLLYLGAPLAFIFGGPVSGWLLQMHPPGSLAGWQWMFLVEGAIAVIVGVWAYWYLDDRPSDAAWMPTEQRRALSDALAGEEHQHPVGQSASLFSLLRDARMLRFVLIYFLIQMSVYGVVFYLPSEVAAILRKPTGLDVGLVTAIPWICALAGALWLPKLATHLGWHVRVAGWTLFAAAVAGFAFPLVGALPALIALCIAATAFIAVQPLFWTFPTSYLSDKAAAGGFALINACGAVGGFVAPNIKTLADAHFHSQRAGLFVLAAATTVCAGLIAMLGHRRGSEERPLSVS